MKKIIVLLFILLIPFTLIGCGSEPTPDQREDYNAKDTDDFYKGSTIKFELVQFQHVLDEKTVSEMNLNGGKFLFMGSITASSNEETTIENCYYGWAKNKDGGIYYMKIPIDEVRIYEDSESNSAYLVAWDRDWGGIPKNSEDNWSRYDRFNLHVPKGTIIPRLNFDFDINNFTSK